MTSYNLLFSLDNNQILLPFFCSSCRCNSRCSCCWDNHCGCGKDDSFIDPDYGFGEPMQFDEFELADGD
jgi:hypothetical protein